MQEKTEVREQPNSCEVSINAKGQWSGKVKVYAGTIEEAKLKAIAQAEELETTIKNKNNQ